MARSRPKNSTAIDKIISRKIRPASPGMAIVVILDGKTVHSAGYGLSNLDSGIPVTPNTRFHMASCGKQFTGLGIMMLKEEGKLKFDDPIGKHIPELSGLPKGLTIRRLLHHLSGVRDLYSNDDTKRRLLALSPLPTNEDLVRFYATMDRPMTKRRGMHWYNNTGYDLLGCVIERVSGQPYDEFFRTRVFDPLGMKDTFSPSAKASPRRRRLATGYEYDKLKKRFNVASRSSLDSICGSGSFYSTVSDLCRYEAALAGNRLVSAATMRSALRSGIDRQGRKIGYGFGWRLAAHFAEHSGHWKGFAAHQRRYRDRQLSIYVLSNNPAVDPWAIVAATAKVFPKSKAAVTSAAKKSLSKAAERRSHRKTMNAQKQRALGCAPGR
jgi:CubicO group peptidase (beta-lactamase class C family)